MTYDAYGTGAKPIITGLTTVTGFVNLGGNIWEAPVTSVTAGVNLVLRNSVIQQVGRYPNANAANSGYLTFTASSSTSITGPALSSVTNWTGAQVAIRATRWEIVKPTVLSHVGGVVTFASVGSAPRTGYGYFFQRDSRTLDIDGEWWYDATNSKLRVYAGNNNPSAYTYQISTIDTLFYTPFGTTFVNNLQFEGSNEKGVFMRGGTNLAVQYCDFNNNGREAISITSATTVIVNGCTTNNTLGSGIVVSNTTVGDKNYTVTNNTLDSTSMIAGMEFCDRVQTSSASMMVRGGNNIDVLNNVITYSGWVGIEWQGNDVAITNNNIQYYCTRRDDGGAIYTVEAGPYYLTPTRTNRNVTYNFCLYGIGQNNGTNEPDGISTRGLYSDLNTRTVVYDYNTVAFNNGDAMHGNNNKDLTFRYNTFYGNVGVYSINRYDSAASQTGFVITNNILYPYRFDYRDLGINFPTLGTKQARIAAMGTIGSNYYYLRTGIDTSLHAITTYVDRSNYTETVNNFSYIQNTCIQEIGSTRVNPTNIASSLQVNPSSSPITYVFTGLSKKDVYGNVYNNSVGIPAWSSIVLIDNGSITNNPPTANAGADQTITLPTSTISLFGSGTDSDGTIASYQWAKMSGPSGTNFIGGGTARLDLTNLVQGVYSFQLTVTDNGGQFASDQVTVTVNAAANIPPIANAGPSQNISLPTSTATLIGTGTDTDGTIVGYAWTKDSGPSCTITTPSSSTTGVTGLTAGIYVFRLTVTDNLSLTGFDTMRIFVTSLPNTPPTANAGSNQTITLPTNTVTLTGIGTDVDGVITNYLWTKILGGTGGTVASPASSTTAINGLTQGVFQYELTVTDNLGLTGKDTVQITVNAAPNTPPTANAGTDQVLTLPTNTTTLTGSGTDVGGSITGYQWIKLPSSPPGSNFTTSTNANLPLTNLIEGIYKFSLTVTDNLGSTGTDTVQVTVNPAANIPPTVTITPPTQSITLPLDSVTVTGSAVDSDGTIISYAWSKISGPSTYQIVTVNSNTTIIRNLIAGTYRFSLTATDNQGATGSATVIITVSPNLTPVPSTSIYLYNWKL